MQHIAKVFYINLDRRTDRRQEIEAELARMGIEAPLAQRFQAIETADGRIGCFKSHLEILKRAREAGHENVLILEDDFEFLVSKEELEAELTRFFEKKIPYDVLMLAYNLHEKEPYDDQIGYARQAGTASGYIVHKDFYDTIINLYEWALPRLIQTKEHMKYMNDTVWYNLQPFSEWFYFIRRIGRQRKSYSDLEQRLVEYGV